MKKEIIDEEIKTPLPAADAVIPQESSAGSEQLPSTDTEVFKYMN